MVEIRARVSCNRCNNPVDKTQAILVDFPQKRNVYECYECFKLRKSGGANKQKQDFYCERCKYKFFSNKKVCPYCGRLDKVISGSFSLHELL